MSINENPGHRFSFLNEIHLLKNKYLLKKHKEVNRDNLDVNLTGTHGVVL